MQAAQECLHSFEGIDEVWIVPCGRRPDKQNLLEPNTRLTLVTKAVHDYFGSENKRVKVDPIEVEHS